MNQRDRRKPKIARADIYPCPLRRREAFFAAALFLAACILCWSAPAAGAPEASEVEQGKTLLREGSYQQAIEVLQSAFRKDPANPEVNFHLGRAAFEAGDYETAVMAFERVLIMNPQAQRAKLELARSFYELGDLESASRYFREVLATAPPETVRLNIESFLTHIAARQKRHFFSGSLALGTGWDDNVRAAPAEDRIETVLGDVILGDDARAEGDRVDTLSLQLNHAFTLRPDILSWQSTFTSYNSFHKDVDDLDLNFLSLTTGPVLRRDNLLLQFYGLYNYLLLDSDRYLGSFGAGASVKTVGASLLQWSAALKAEEKTFFSLPEKDATNVSLVAGPVLQWGPNRLTLSGLAERENAEGDENSYDRLGVLVGAQRQLPAGFALGVELRFQDTSYDEASLLFTEARDDDLIEITAEISKQLWRSPDNRQTLLARLRNTYSESRSNQDLFEYDKNTIAATLNLFF